MPSEPMNGRFWACSLSTAHLVGFLGAAILLNTVGCPSKSAEPDLSSVRDYRGRLTAADVGDESTFKLAREIQGRFGSSPASHMLQRKVQLILEEDRNDWGASRNVAYWVVASLADCHDRHTIPVLFRCLGHKDDRIEWYASKGLERITGLAFSNELYTNPDAPMRRKHINNWRHAYERLRSQHPEEYWPALVE